MKPEILPVKKSILIKCIYFRIFSQTLPDGKIERKKLFEILGERLGKILEEDREKLIEELKVYGIIKESDKFGFTVDRHLAF